MKMVNDVASGLPNSPIRRMFNIAATMSDVVSFTVGEPDFVTPRNIMEAANRAALRGETHYTANAGILPLRQAVSRRAFADSGLASDPEREVIVTAGGMEALILCMMVAIEPGDEVIITDPHWSNYPQQVTMCGGVPRFVPVREANGFVYDPDDVRRAIGKRTKMIIVNSPANPTGGVADKATLRELAKIAVERDILVISDEVYRHFLYDGAEFASIAQFEGMKERTILIDSFSKTYAMTGWRVGFAVGPEEMVRNMVKYQENVVGSVNTPAQYAAIEALEGPQDSLRAMIERYSQRRKLLVGGLNAIEGVSCVPPKGAFYCFVNVSRLGKRSEDFAMELLKSTGVVVVPGSGFGDAGEGFVRMSYATSEENIEKGLARIKRFVESGEKGK
jgi:aminotransferase